MSFDALTITGLIAAILCSGFLIALITRDDADTIRQAGLTGSDHTNPLDHRS